ncbi:NAD(P)H dehydrogenase assembly family protein, partial [Synechococcus sp. R55.3]
MSPKLETAAGWTPIMSEAQGLLPVGATVQVVEMPPYLKTADPMP